MASRKWWWGGIIAGAAAALCIAAAVVLAVKFLPNVKALTPVGKKIAVLELKGPIRESDGLIEIIHDYRDDPTVAAVVVYVDSPGGVVAPTQEIYTELLGLKEKHKKVYAYISSVGASGGYYVACAADKIYANPGTITGSIGVIMTFTNVEGLFGKIGLSNKTIKTGAYKDIGSPFRPMTPEEEGLLGEMLDDVYQQFVDVVVRARQPAIAAKLQAQGEKSPTKYAVRRYVLTYADGRIFSGRQARDLGFVDELGNFQQCLKDVAADVGIKGKPTVIRRTLKKPSLYDSLFGEARTRFFGLSTTPSVEVRYSVY